MAYGINSTAKTTRQRVAKMRAADRAVEWRDCESVKRRVKLEADCEQWLKKYKPNNYFLPFSDIHREIISAAVQVLDSGAGMVVAAPRRFGKSTLLGDIALYAVLTGRCAFPVVVGWEKKASDRMLRGWLEDLSENDELAADYPDACAPFQITTQGKALENLTWDGGPHNGENTGAVVKLSASYICLPGGRALLAGSIKGSLRGLRIQMGGKWVRPDVVFLDDPQDSPTAKSETLSGQVIKRIDHDLMSLSGPTRRMAMFAAVTVIEEDDVAEQLLDRPDVKAIRTGQVLQWPVGFFDKNASAARELWDEWNELRQDAIRAGDDGKKCRTFYKKNKAEMIDGFDLAWPECMDKDRKDIDGFYATMWDYYRLGHEAFMAERQNQPVKQGVTLYTLTPDIICSRMDNRDAGQSPEWVRLRVATTDVNYSYGLTYAVLGFGADQTAGVLVYGVHDMGVSHGATEAEIERAIYEALVVHGRSLYALPCRPELWAVDAGGSAFDIVNRFAKESVGLCGLQAIPATGRGTRNYRPYGKTVVGQPREQCHMAADTRGRKWIAWHADYWREQAQKGWTGSVGAPGSCSLPAGNHRDFAEQICREQLKGKGDIGGQMQWVWNTAPGRHDYGDCMSMAYMLAAWGGIGTGGKRTAPKKYKERRKAKVPIAN